MLPVTRKYWSKHPAYYLNYSLAQPFDARTAKQLLLLIDRHFSGFQVNLNGKATAFDKDSLPGILSAFDFDNPVKNHFALFLHMPFFFQNPDSETPAQALMEDAFFIQIDNSGPYCLLLNVETTVFSEVFVDYSMDDEGVELDFSGVAKLNRQILGNFIADIHSNIAGKMQEQEPEGGVAFVG